MAAEGTTRQRVGIVGMGYVGLPLAVAFAEAGCDVVAVETNAQRVESLSKGESYIEDVASERLAAVLPRVRASREYESLMHADAVIVCVPTPLTANREPELGPLLGCARELSAHLRQGQVVVLESTPYPGTTRDCLVPALETSGLTAGRDFNVAFSPERVDPGRTD